MAQAKKNPKHCIEILINLISVVANIQFAIFSLQNQAKTMNSDNNHNNELVENNNSEYPRKQFLDFRTLEIKKARVKFFNDKEDKNFGFVTVLNEDDKPIFDAFLSGAVLEKAGIYPPLEKGEILYIRHITKPKGETVVLVQRKAPAPIDTDKAA